MSCDSVRGVESKGGENAGEARERAGNGGSRSRHTVVWLLLLLAGGSVVGGMAWVAWTRIWPRYTATAQLRVARASYVVFPAPADPEEFARYKAAQAELVKSRFVLSAALRQLSKKNVTCVQREEDKHNALNWLSEKLRVGFTDKDSEIMEISLTEADPREAAAVVNAVVQAYWDEVVNAEKIDKRSKLYEIQTICAEKENDVRQRRSELKNLVEQLGTSEGALPTARQQVAIQQCADYQRELARVRFDLARAKARLQIELAMHARLESEEVAELEAIPLLQNDSEFRELSLMAARAQLSAAQLRRLPAADVSSGESAAFKSRRDGLMAFYVAKLRDSKRIERLRETRRLEAEAAVLTQQEKDLASQVEQQQKELVQFDRTSTEVKMMQMDLRHQEEVFDALVSLREKLRIELRSRPRVRILGNESEPAEVPENPD